MIDEVISSSDSDDNTVFEPCGQLNCRDNADAFDKEGVVTDDLTAHTGPMISEQFEKSDSSFAFYQPQYLRGDSVECEKRSRQRSKKQTTTKRELSCLKTAIDGEHSVVHTGNGGTAPPTPDDGGESGKEWHTCMMLA